MARLIILKILIKIVITTLNTIVIKATIIAITTIKSTTNYKQTHKDNNNSIIMN